MRVLLLLPAILLCVTEASAQRAPSGPRTDGSITIEQPSEWGEPGAAAARRGVTVSVRKSLRVVGIAEHPAGVGAVLLNGKRAAVQRLPNGSVRFSGYLPIDGKTTSASVVGVTPAGAQFGDKFPIEPAPAPRRDTAVTAVETRPAEAFDSASSGFKGRRYAVVIGISKYRDADVPQLRFADRDAKAFYDFLRSESAGLGGIAPANITFLKNEQATFMNIRKALFGFLKVATEEDIVYIYYAGHGAPDPDRKQNLFLLPYDADASNISSTAVPMEDIDKAVKQLYAKHVVMFIDACHSAGVGGDVATRALSLNEINAAFSERLEHSSGGLAIFNSSEKTQESQEDVRWGGGHGVFTYFMLEALRGAADEDRDQIVSLGEMMEWTRTRVARDTRNAQVPSIAQTAFDRHWPMAVVLPGAVIPEISDAELEQAAHVSNVMSSAFDFPWKTVDSLVTVVGTIDTMVIRLQNETLDVLPGHLLTYATSNSDVLQVDSFGALYPKGPGMAAVTARGLNRTITLRVRVHDRPRQINFTPADTALELVITEKFDIKADLLVGSGQWLRDVVPKLTLPDTFILRREPGGGYVAVRDGTTSLTGSVGGITRTWVVHVKSPLVRLGKQPATMLIGDSLPLRALMARRDGTILSEALGVRWESSDTSLLQIKGNYGRARGIGQVRLIGMLGPEADTVSISILGDLLIAIEQNGRSRLTTMSVVTSESFPIGPDSIAPADAALSPDGKHIVFSSVKNRRLYIMNADGSGIRLIDPIYPRGLRVGSREEHRPQWTADGKRIVFVSNRPGNYEIFSMTPLGEDVQRLTNDGAVDWRVSSAPDAPRIAWERVIAASDGDVFVSLADGTQAIGATDQGGFSHLSVSEMRPSLLPGGNMLLFTRGTPGLDPRAGVSLLLYDLSKKVVVRELVKPLKDHDIIYAVAPDGLTIAYHMLATWGRKNSTIAVINMDGLLLKTLNLGKDTKIREITWGAVALKPEKARD